MIAPRPLTAEAPAASTATAILAALLEARAGQTLAPERLWRVETALRPLLREHDLSTLDQLVARLLGNRDPGIGDRIVEALLNGETSFFRDPLVFEAVVETITSVDRRARIWSAGCSTGQEPLSLAMLLAERLAGARMPEIVASDLSAMALARAATGLYSQFEIQRGLAIGRALRWFEAQASSDWLASPELRRAIDYRRVNLVDDDWAGQDWAAARFDAILCRNVLLYVAPALKPALFERFAAVLRPGGILVLGAGETVIGQTRLFEPCAGGRGLYRRADAAR